MITKYKVLIPVLIALSFGLMALKADHKSKIAGQWQLVPDFKTQDSMFQAQIKSVDTLSDFPDEFKEMKEQLPKMTTEELLQIPEEMLEMLNISNLDSFKMKAQASLLEGKKKQDEIEKNHIVVYDFQANGVIKLYAVDYPDQVDTTTCWKEDKAAENIVLFKNPSILDTELGVDSVTFKILYLSADSLSLKVVKEFHETTDKTSVEAIPEVPMPERKPMNFKRYTPVE